MSSPTRSTVSRKEDASPSNGADQRDEEAWSAEEEVDSEGDSRKRKRSSKAGRPTSVSCELCKTRKVKCDRGHPNCGWCLRNGQVCEYRERKKPGLRAGYGRELEARLDKLEGVLQTQQHVLQQLASGNPSGQAVAGSLTSPGDQSRHVPHTETALFMQTPYPTAAPVARRPSGLQTQLSNEVNQQQQQSFLRHASDPSNHLPSTVTSSDVYGPSNPPLESPSLNIPSASHNSLTTQDGAMNAVSQDQDFPPYDLLYALTDLFFKHINTWCPILHRRTTLDSLFGPSTLDEADRILLHAIVATTLRFSAGEYDSGRLLPITITALVLTRLIRPSLERTLPRTISQYVKAESVTLRARKQLRESSTSFGQCLLPLSLISFKLSSEGNSRGFAKRQARNLLEGRV